LFSNEANELAALCGQIRCRFDTRIGASIAAVSLGHANVKLASELVPKNLPDRIYVKVAFSRKITRMRRDAKRIRRTNNLVPIMLV